MCKGLCYMFEIIRKLNKTTSFPFQKIGISLKKWQRIMIHNNVYSLCRALYTQYFKES